MDMEQSLERWTATDKAIVICQEANENFTLNTGQFLVRNCECPSNSASLKTLIDQPHFMKVYEENAWARGVVDIRDQREFNSFWHQVSE
jgi:nitrite reductase/ring-hydroxylating ferredoxin subunit